MTKKSRKTRSDNSDKNAIINFSFVGADNVQNPLILKAFVAWIAVPKEIRKPKLQREFAKLHGIDTDTLSLWKDLVGFWDEVKAYRGGFFRKYSTDVFYGLVKAAKNGNPKAVELFAKLFEGYSEKIQIKEEALSREFTPEEKEKMKQALRNAGMTALMVENSKKP